MQWTRSKGHLYCWLPRAVRGAKPGMKKCSLGVTCSSFDVPKSVEFIETKECNHPISVMSMNNNVTWGKEPC